VPVRAAAHSRTGGRSEGGFHRNLRRVGGRRRTRCRQEGGSLRLRRPRRDPQGSLHVDELAAFLGLVVARWKEVDALRVEMPPALKLYVTE
jgi:hypothetical protein